MEKVAVTVAQPRVERREGEKRDAAWIPSLEKTAEEARGRVEEENEKERAEVTAAGEEHRI